MTAEGDAPASRQVGAPEPGSDPGSDPGTAAAAAAANWVGWDVGGAHLKVALLDAGGTCVVAHQEPCALWRGLDELDRAIDRIAAVLAHSARDAAGWSRYRHAATMTGELADAFANRRQGVAAIAARLASCLADPGILFYAGRAGFRGMNAVERLAGDIASANWHATAAWAASQRHCGTLIDVGSTTTDVVPLHGGAVAAVARDDAARLEAGELVYTGIARTPVMALARSAPVGGRWIPLMAEHFATAADIYRMTGELDERHDQHPAADNGPKTVEASARRLARMVGHDVESLPPEAWHGLARALREMQVARIVRAVEQVESRRSSPGVGPIVAAGCGAFVAAEIARRLRRDCVEFANLVPVAGVESRAVAQCAPAIATALLARSGAATVSLTG